MKVLVTGGAGFIGSHLVRGCLEAGDQVRVLDDFSSGRRENLAGLEGVDLIEGSVLHPAGVSKAVAGCEVVYHLAAQPSVPLSVEAPLESHAINVTGTVEVLDAAYRADVGRVIFASSCAVYGDLPELPKREDMPLLPLSPYALHKEIGERYCRQYHEIYDLATVALRFFNVYGPGQDPSSGYAAAIPRFATQLAGGEQPTVFGDGLQTRDFVFVSDVVAACRSAAAAPEPALGRVINIASGEQTSVLEVLTQLKQVLDCDKIEPLMGAPRDGDVRHSVADVALAAKLLDWRPAVALGEGIEVTTRALEGAT